jgi:hypothetical protein
MHVYIHVYEILHFYRRSKFQIRELLYKTVPKRCGKQEPMDAFPSLSRNQETIKKQSSRRRFRDRWYEGLSAVSIRRS